MARKKRKKAGGRDWKKGQSGNPNGRPPTPPDLKAARELNKQELERVLNKYLYLTMDELETLAKDGSLPGLDALVVSVVVLGRRFGCQKRFGFLLDRLIGTVKNTVQVEGLNLEQLVAGSNETKEK